MPGTGPFELEQTIKAPFSTLAFTGGKGGAPLWAPGFRVQGRETESIPRAADAADIGGSDERTNETR